MEIHRQAKTILMEMGQFYQVLDDFVDCYGPEHAHTNDIEDGKCTWLAVVALQRASDKQKRLLQVPSLSPRNASFFKANAD